MYPTGGGMQEDNPWMPKKKPRLFGDPSTFTAALNQQSGDYDSIMKLYDDFISRNNPLGSSNGNNSTGSSINSGASITGRPIQSGGPISAGNPLTNRPISSGNPLTNRPVSSGSPLNAGSPITSNPIGGSRNINFSPLTAKTTDYKQSDDVTGSLSRLKDLTDTGGYSASGIQDIRERNLSPIRSIYASGKQGLERQRALSGGYSPNFNAVSASMARDQASKISDITTRTNADIAQNVAGNRIAVAPQYASAAAGANNARTAVDQRNTDIINQINEANAGRKFDTDRFNTSTGLETDRYNRDTQLGIDRDNRDTSLSTQRENRNFQFGADKYNEDNRMSTERGNRDFYSDIDKYNENNRMGVERSNRDTQLSTDRDNRDYQTNIDKSNRDFQSGLDISNRDSRLSTDKFNSDSRYRDSESSRSSRDAEINRILEAIRGKASMYGATPGLTNMFGSQVVQAGQLGQSQQELNNRRRSQILSAGGARG